MDNALWLAVLASAVGTLLMRLLPLLWMQRRLDQADGFDAMPQWLGVLGPLMIAALLGVSLVPAKTGVISWLATTIGVLVTLYVWWRLRSLGWPVVAGVVVYGVVLIAARSAT